VLICSRQINAQPQVARMARHMDVPSDKGKTKVGRFGLDASF
jgi:hypothetical protein